jgi:hypothetical protein
VVGYLSILVSNMKNENENEENERKIYTSTTVSFGHNCNQLILNRFRCLEKLTKTSFLHLQIIGCFSHENLDGKTKQNKTKRKEKKRIEKDTELDCTFQQL